MKVQLRRFVTIGLMSGSLAISAIAGGAVVGAAAPNSATVSTDAPIIRSHEERDYATGAAAPTDRVVTVTATNAVTPATTPVQVFNDDRRN